MATQAFNELVGNIIVGLLEDTRTDEAYEYVLPLHNLYVTTMDEHAKDPQYLQMKFIGAIRSQPTFRECFRSQDLARLEHIALNTLPDSVAGSIKEIALSIGVPELFKEDAQKKLWKKIKKLVIKHCNLGNFVYDDVTKAAGEEEDDAVVVQDRATQLSDIREERARRFNHGYRAFVEQLVEAFPYYTGGDDDISREALSQFDSAVGDDIEAVIRRFKVVVLPIVPKIAMAIQEKQRGVREGEQPRNVEEVFAPYFGGDATWFKQLPFVEYVNVDGYWDATDRHNRDIIQKAVSDLAVCMSGLDMLMYSPIVNRLRDKAVEIMSRPDMKGTAVLPNQAGFDKTKAMSFVMELVQSLPEATNYQISSDDIKQLIMNTFSGSADIPDSFAKVFSPDMIDEDCLDVVIEMPGIGDVMAPIMAGMEGQTKGHTGKPAFSAVPKPGWLQRDK